MARTVSDILNVADQEWKHWGNSTWNLSTDARHIRHKDDDRIFAKYVIKNYNSVGGGTPTEDDVMNDHYFWSAVGISYVFHAAQFSKKEFPFAESHSVWIRHFIKARKQNSTSALYHGYRLKEAGATPDVGDIVGYTYDKVSFQQAQGYYDKVGSYKSHTDIVVARRPGEIDVIGFNVLDSVTKKTIPLSESGHIADTRHKWFVVLKKNALN
ncbi:DUF2272 domain-containing protein [Rhizobium rhizogenes]|uniref:DUF2272 domain-containing protein n=1 Tax=Rhizobium rhizogenes TaxID=359 RepID=A0AA88F3X6_RHIRH|nr:DUF2272 domain-containing protein [Rhizobium rhizogenes]KAA3504492.1 DUF2272 domain-containing protein [Rhizobium rhizogenes]